MSDLSSIIEEAFENRANLGSAAEHPDVAAAVNQAIGLLDSVRSLRRWW